VLLLPGNHDLEAYAPGQDWGGPVRLMLSTPVHETAVEGLRILGVPFPDEPTTFARVRRHVEDRLAAGGGAEAAVLVLHGTLVDAADPHIQTESQADEPDDRYFPVRTGELAGLDVAYVALGHYHRAEERRAGAVPVAYAGAPAPIGAHALGPRTAMLVEVEEGEGPARVERVRLPVPWRDRIERWLTPFEEAAELDALEAELRERGDPGCTLTVELEGVLAGMDEAELRRRTEELAAELSDAYAGLRFERRGVGLDPARADLFREFRQRLEAWADEEGERPDGGVRRRALELAARALKG
jgi:DNA repair exonuclease SbcCD nuclease subunit